MQHWSEVTEKYLVDLYPPTRVLEGLEVLKFARGLADHPELWHDSKCEGSSRHFERIWSDCFVNAWIIKWLDGSDTGWHDHGVSGAGIFVVDGAIIEDRLSLNGQSTKIHQAGTGYPLCKSVIHRVRPDGDNDSIVTINAYSPPLKFQGVYKEWFDGTLRREVISHDEELKASIR